MESDLHSELLRPLKGQTWGVLCIILTSQGHICWGTGVPQNFRHSWAVGTHTRRGDSL